MRKRFIILFAILLVVIGVTLFVSSKNKSLKVYEVVADYIRKGEYMDLETAKKRWGNRQFSSIKFKNGTYKERADHPPVKNQSASNY